MIHPLRKLPRGQLYFEPALVAIRTLQHAFRPLNGGERVERFEHRFAALTGCNHAIALPHARVGIWQVLRALQLPAGGVVLTTPVTVPEVFQAIELAGLRPRLVDLGERTGQVDVEALSQALDGQCCALLITHLCGLVSDMTTIAALAREHGVPIIEDASQALGARWQGRMVGGLGKAGVFSISTLKPVSSFHGGVVVTDDDELARRLRGRAFELPPRPRRTLPAWLARDYSMYLASQPAVLGTLGWPLLRWAERLAPEAVAAFQRGRLWPSADAPGQRRRHGGEVPEAWQVAYSDYQADLALGALERLAAGTARRQHLAELLLAELVARGVPGLAAAHPDSEPIHWRLPLWVDDVQAVRAGLAARGVDTTTTNLQCCDDYAEGVREGLPNARAFVERALFLPLHPDLRASDMMHIAAAVADTLSGASGEEGP